MKKVVLAIAALCMGYAVNAQVILGGNLGFGLSNSMEETTKVNGSTTTTSDWNGPRDFTFEFKPKIGYQINNRLSAGVLGGYSMKQKQVINTTPDDGSGWLNYRHETTTISSSWEVTPYLRYAAVEYGKLSFFMEFAVPFVWNTPDKIHTDTKYTVDGKETHTENDIDGPKKSFVWGISMTPGFNYALNEHCSIDLYVDVFEIAFRRTKTTNYLEGDDWSNEDITHRNDFKLAINSLPSSNMFRLGFNYTF